MPTPRAWWRLAARSSAAALAVLTTVLAAVIPASPVRAADKTSTVTYTCTGGPVGDTSLTVPISVPDTASGTFEVTWKLPALTLRTAPATATQLLVAGALQVTGGVHADLEVTDTAVAAGATSVPAAQKTSTVTVTAVTGGQITVKPSAEPGSLMFSLADAPAAVTTCTTTGTQSVTVAVGQPGGGSGAGDLVEYTCTDQAQARQEVRIRVTLTMPDSPGAGVPFTIGWTGAYEPGAELKAPAAGLPAGVKLYAHAGISGLPGLTSATGAGTPGAVTPGQVIALPSSVELKATSGRTGSATVRPGAVNIGAQENAPLIECEVKDREALRTYPLTVGAGGADPSATSTPTPTPSPSTTRTRETGPAREPGRSRTPKDGVATGAGGDAGPDGRVFLLTGSALVAFAAAGGLLARRRRASPGT
ncbi:hypothetical protein [Nonomuraea indica]|uniref:Gram-positive cocci surface proteins LPxTG domain-containing protein n=1 Tax=Nonomuraea indica TaxID=1581193 RepID=A0ABW8A691_9ACTN